MTANQFLGNVALIFGWMSALAAVELAVPLFARPRSERPRIPMNLGLTVLTLVLNALLITLAPARSGRALAALPPLAVLVLTVVLLDLATYAAHRTMHALPWLWRAHRIHHADSFVDVTTSLRQHPLEGLWRFAWILAPVWLLGLPASAVMTYRLLSALQGALEHANLRVPARIDRALGWLWVTPAFHKLHHSIARRDHDANYGNLFSVFDRAFGSALPTTRVAAIRYGLDDPAFGEPRSLWALLALGVRSSGGAGALGTADLGRGE